MADEKVKEVSDEEVGSAVSAKKGRERKPNKYVEEWVTILPGSTNAMSADVKAFIDPYAKCRDALVPHTNGYELFMYFFYNRIEHVPI